MKDLDLTLESYGVLAELAPSARSYLCVGVSEGECLRHVVEANPLIERLALCDTWGREHGGTGRGSHGHIEEMLAKLRYRGHVSYFDGRSQILIPTLPQHQAYDLSYVDGSHVEEEEYADLVNVWPHTNKAMVVHDARQPQVWSAIGRWLDTVKDAYCAGYCNAGFGTLVVFR